MNMIFRLGDYLQISGNAIVDGNTKLSISGNIIQQAYNRITESRIMEGKQGIEQELSRVAGIPEVQQQFVNTYTTLGQGASSLYEKERGGRD